MNDVLLTGRFTRDPIIMSGKKAKAAKFNITAKNNSGRADYINCVTFNQRADYIEKNCRKGSLITVHGYLHTSSYVKDGTRIYNTEVLVDKLETYGAKNDVINYDEDIEPMDDLPFD